MSNHSYKKAPREQAHQNGIHANATLTEDWSYATKELLDSLPQSWTRGLLYFLVIFMAIAVPWSILFKVDETGTARGQIEPQGETIKLDAAVTGSVAKIIVKEGDSVQKGQAILVLESELVATDLKEIKDKLAGQLNRLSQLKILENQLIFTLTTQQQHNRSQSLEKEAQIAQAKQNFLALKNNLNLQKDEKLAKVNQAKETIANNLKAAEVMKIRLANAKREVDRYKTAWQEGIASEIQLVQSEDTLQERIRLYDQAKSDIEQSQLRLEEQESSYQKTLRQAKAEIEQAQLRLQEQERSYQSLIHSNKLAVLKIEEQLKNLATEITTLQAEIAQSKSQVTSLQFQLEQRVLKAPMGGQVFQLPIKQPGSVVQAGTRIAEIAPQGSHFIVRAQVPTNESGFLRQGLPVKLKFDAYPFQDYGVMNGEVVKISPTTSEIETSNGKVAAYFLEIALERNCIPTSNQCIPLHPGDTVTAEIIIRQRRIIDFILDPFKKLQQGGVEL